MGHGHGHAQEQHIVEFLLDTEAGLLLRGANMVCAAAMILWLQAVRDQVQSEFQSQVHTLQAQLQASKEEAKASSLQVGCRHAAYVGE